MNQVEDFYNRSAEQEWNRLENHRTEFAVSMKALLAHLPKPPANLIDIGSGPGRYSIELAKEGYQVTLVDLSKESLKLASEKAAEAHVSFHDKYHLDATDLSKIPDDSFEGVLLFGPLYHLLDEKKRQQAVNEAKRVLKPGGLIFATFISRFAPFRESAVNEADWVTNNSEYAYSVLKSGKHTEGEKFPHAYFAHPDETQPLMEGCGLTTINIVGVEGIVACNEEEVNKLQGPDWDKWVDLNYKFGQEPSLYGASDHLLYIGQKSS